MIDRDRTRFAMLGDRSIERISYRSSGHALSHLQDRAPATPLIDDGQDPKRSTVDQCIVDEIHAPALMGACGRRRNAAVQARVLTLPDAVT